MESVETFDNLLEMLKYIDYEDEEGSLWRRGSDFWTVSSAVLDLENCVLHLCDQQSVSTQITSIEVKH